MSLVIKEVTEEYLSKEANLRYVGTASIIVYFWDIIINFDTEVSTLSESSTQWKLNTVP